MKSIIVVGSGGREHAIVRALRKSSDIEQIYAFPGSDGMFKEAKKLDVSFSDISSSLNISKFVDKICELKVDLVVIGPEQPLMDGLSDALREKGIDVFGPCSQGAKLEGDKVFAKEFMKEFSIPSGGYLPIKNTEDLEKALNNKDYSDPYVFKYRYLAGGKGVLVSKSKDEIRTFSKKFLDDKTIQSYLEEPLRGWELSCICLVNESGYDICPILQDHKRLNNSDLGPNTGGMGVAGPLRIDAELKTQIVDRIVKPSVEGLKKRNFLFRGVLYIGVMVTKDGPQVLEYNVRFGDPEAQLIFPLVESDWCSVLSKVSKGLNFSLEQKKQFGCSVVLASEGYPDSPVKGAKIEGLDDLSDDNYFHAGTKKHDSEDCYVNGGRVLNILGFGDDQSSAIQNAYENVEKIKFKGMQYRTDIGSKIL